MKNIKKLDNEKEKFSRYKIIIDYFLENPDRIMANEKYIDQLHYDWNVAFNASPVKELFEIISDLSTKSYTVGIN